MSSSLLEKCSGVHKFWEKKILYCSRTLMLLEYYFDPVAYYLCEGKFKYLTVLFPSWCATKCLLPQVSA